MIGNEIAFVLAPEAGPGTVLDALASRFACREGAGGLRREVFYDTFDGRLHRKGAALCASEEETGWRLRWSNGTGTARETRTDRPIAFVRELGADRLREVLEPVVEMRRLLPLVEVEVRGPALDVVDDEEKTVVRVRLEEGRARAPRERSPWHAMPSVVKVLPVRGYEGEWRGVVEALEGVAGLERTGASSLDVALAAIGGAPAKGLSTGIALEPDVRADVGLERVCSALLDVVRANEGGVRASLDTEFLHDFRVAVRRSRALLGQMKSVFPPAVVKHFREELAWLGRATGPTRDLDVFLLDLDELTSGQPEADVAPLREFLRIRRARAGEELCAVLDTDRYEELLVGWRRFLDEPVVSRPPQPDAERPLAEVAAERLRKLHGRVLDHGRAVHEDSPADDLHRVRLDCKKLRYVLDATKSLYKRKRVAKWIEALKRLQDCLGNYNDCCVQSEKLREFAYAMSEEGRAPVGTLLCIGRIVERTSERAARERAAFVERFADFASDENEERFARLFGKDRR